MLISVGIPLVVIAAITVVVVAYFRLQAHRADAVAMASDWGQPASAARALGNHSSAAMAITGMRSLIERSLMDAESRGARSWCRPLPEPRRSMLIRRPARVSQRQQNEVIS